MSTEPGPNGRTRRRLAGCNRAPTSQGNVWTRSALNRLLGDEDQAEVRPGLSGAERSGVMERVPDRSDAGGRPQPGRQAHSATDAVGTCSVVGEGHQGRLLLDQCTG